MTGLARYERRDAVGVITINNPPLNLLSSGVPEGIIEHLGHASADGSLDAVVLIGGGRHFIAGADINNFGLPPQQWPDVRGLVAALADHPKSIIAAIRGAALGGGLEVAQACHYRIAARDARLGQPEVKLGLLPGAGGTQRLPRLVGLEAALQMIVTGDPVGADHALRIGLVDQLADGDLLEAALAFANELVAEGASRRRAGDLAVASEAPADQVIADARKRTSARSPELLAALGCIDALEAATTLPFDEGLKRERALFMQLVQSDQSRALRHIFLAERNATKVAGLASDAEPKSIRAGAVLGAGTMGSGIAMNFADAGIPVHVLEVDQESLDRGLGVIERDYRRSVDRERLTPEEMAERLGLIHGVLDDAAIAESDLVIEAVFEDMSLKKEVFSRLDAAAKPGAVLATNTSTLDVDEIAAVTSRPEAVVGMHFFSPANVMRLLEVVRGDKTSDETLLTAITLGKRMRKIPVVVGVCDGFVGNRMLHRYMREAFVLIEDGALPQQVDRVMTDFGLAMGPFAVGDLAGLDIGYRIRKRQAVDRPPDERYPRIADKVVEMGRLGQKTGAGFYRYPQGGRTPVADPEITELILQHSAELGITRRELSDEEILKRLLYQLVNEGAKILAEGIAQRASDIDVIYVHGYGFPRHRGGPMFHAGLVGLADVLADVRRFHGELGDTWEPAPLLVTLAEQGRTFAEYDRAQRSSPS